MTSFHKKLWRGLIILALLTPLGVVLPKLFNAEDAWGEWGADTLEKLLGYVPEGLRKLAEVWHAPVADYNFGGPQSHSSVEILSYIASALIGIAAVAASIYLISRFLVKHDKK